MEVSRTAKVLQEMVANELACHCAEDSPDKECRISWVDADDVILISGQNFKLRYACYAGYICAYGTNDVSCTRCKK